jgi:chaperonin cofactor prefoldin
MKYIQRTIYQLEQEKDAHLRKLEEWRQEQEILKQEEMKVQIELNETTSKLTELYELKKETDVYYNQIQQSVETLLALLSSSR